MKSLAGQNRTAGDPSALVFRFGDFELDEAKRELRREGVPIRLQPKAFDLLRYLVRNRDRVVSKEELLDSIWADECVTLWSLTTCLRKARRALGALGEDLVQTRHGHGVRFVGACEQVRVASSELPARPLLNGTADARSRVVGRDTELALLQRALEAALAAHGNTVLLSGEQGVGKSTLIGALSEMAYQAGAVVLAGAAYDGEGEPTFWPWIEVTRAGLAAVGGAAAMLPQGVATTLASLVPEVLPELSAARVEGDSSQVRFRIYDAVSQYLERAARLTPLVVVIEDLHWADAVSVALLAFLARRVEPRRMLLVATLREGAQIADEALVTEIARLLADPSIRTIKLAGLNVQSTKELVERLMPMPLPAGFSEGVRHATGGVPLFVEQLASHLLAAAAGRSDRHAALADALGKVPDASAHVIERNLARLSASTREVLAAAAVIGSDFDLDYVARVLHADTSVALATARSAARAAMQEAIRARVIALVPERDDVFRFAHGIFRSAVYRAIGADQRSRLHWLAGKESERRLRRGEAEIGEVAEHLVHGVDHGSPAAAVELCRRAAALAAERTDFARASILLDHADRLARHDERLSRTRRIEIQIALAENLARAGRTRRAHEVAERAIASARAKRRAVLFARAALSVGPPMQLQGGVDRERVAVLEEALALLPPKQVGLRVQTLWRLAIERFYEDDRGAACSRLTQEAVDLARTDGSESDLLAALVAQLEVLGAPDQFERQRAAVAEAEALAERLGDHENRSYALAYEAFVLVQLGRFEDAEARMQEAKRWGKLARSPLAEVRSEMWRCFIATARGEWAVADGHVVAAEVLAEFIDEDLLELMSMNRLHVAHMRSLVTPEMAQASADHFPRRCEFAIALIDSFLDAGALDSARATIESRFPNGVDDLAWDPRWLPSALRLAMSWARLGDRQRCAHAYERLLPYNGRHLIFGHRGVGGYFGTVEWGLGALASALGRWSQAEEHLRATTALFRKLGLRPFLGMALCDQAVMLRRQGSAQEQAHIERILDEAAVIAQELPMEGLQRSIAALRSA